MVSLPVGALSVDSLVFEVVQRCFRNSVVACIRARLSETLGDVWQDEIKASFTAEEWRRIESNANLSAATGFLDRSVKDAADFLSVNHFYNIIERNYDALIPENSRGQPDTDRVLKQMLLKNIKSIKDVRDPLSHPPEEDISSFDALNLVHTVLSVLRTLGLDDSTERITKVRSELACRAASVGENIAATNKLEASLPPREEVFDQFVGRTAELEDLWKWLSEPAMGRWVLVGDGGKGKSAVAYQFGDTVRRSGVAGLCGVFWLSAKKRQFEDGEIRPISSPDFWDLDSALSKLLTIYGYDLLATKATAYKQAEVLNLLTGLPALIIVDDIDSIEAADEDVVEFFTYHAPRTSSKILLTSRRLFQGMAKSSTVIRGMSHDDARSFLMGIVQKMDIDRPNLPRYFTQIAEITEGSPLYMEDVLRLCRHLPADKAIEKWKQHSGDSARKYALERELELLSRPARDIIDACSLSKVGFTVAQLERVTGHDEDSVMAGLRELEKAYLVPGSVLVDGDPAFTVNQNLRWLVRRKIAKSEGRMILRESIQAVVGAGSATLDEAVELHIRQIRVLSSSDRDREALAVAHAGMQTPRLRTNPLFLAAVANLYASVDPPRMADAREAWTTASKAGLSSADAYIQWCKAEERSNNWHELREAAELGLDNCDRMRYMLFAFAGRGSTRIGQIQKRAGNRTTEFDRASAYLDKAIDDAFAEGAKTELPKLYRALYSNARAMGSAAAAAEVLRRWLNWNKRDPDGLEALDQFAKKEGAEARRIRQLIGKR